jgi:hypothetical protein
MKPPNSRERQIMQHLRGAGWVKATRLPDSPKGIANLIGKGWIECQQTEGGQAYRLTELGLQAKKALLPVRSGRNDAPSFPLKAVDAGRGRAIEINGRGGAHSDGDRDQVKADYWGVQARARRFRLSFKRIRSKKLNDRLVEMGLKAIGKKGGKRSG